MKKLKVYQTPWLKVDLQNDHRKGKNFEFKYLEFRLALIKK